MRSKIFYINLLLILFAFAYPHYGADVVQNDSLTTIISPDDSLLSQVQPDTQIVDSTQSKEQLDAPIKYWTENGTVSRQGNKLYLTGNAKIVYQDLTLEAEKIVVDQQNNYLFAEGVKDSVDSLGNMVFRGNPVLTEKGQEPIQGNTIYYDFKTKRGKVNYGKTEMPPGYYKGERIDKIGTKTLLVEQGYFTSCELIDNPHFYFKSTKMRVVLQDRIIARPVYFYIADIPLFVIPFGVFPSKGGRHSGLMIPSYGESTYGGRFLKNMGYYWAPSDYFDIALTADFYDKLGFTYSADANYNVRYKLNGSVSGFYFPKDPNTGTNSERWAIRFNHKQNVDPTLSINASGQFQSDKTLAQDLASDIRERTNQLLTSNLTANKTFKGTKNSLSLNVGITENLNTGRRDYTLPNIRFSRSQATLIETFTGKSVGSDKTWYENIYFSYNGNLLHRGSEVPQNDSLNTIVYDKSEGVEHRISLNSPNKIFKYFNITPSINYQEIWVSEVTEPTGYDTTTSGSINLITEQKKQFAARRTFNASLGLRTTLYGMFEPNIGSLKFIRHKIDPVISYTVTPDFSQEGFGYYNYVTDENGDPVYDNNGNQLKVDKFSKNPFGSTGSRRSEFLSFSLANLFQGKIIDGDEETKIDLFTLNFSSGYDFAAEEFNLRDLRTNFRATPVPGINLNLTATQSFYLRSESGDSFIDETVFSEGKLPILKTMTASTAFALDNKMFMSSDEEKESKEAAKEKLDIANNEGILESDNLKIEKLSDENAAKNLDIPWRINFTLNYNLNRTNLNNITERLDLGTTASLSITKNWRINWTARFDVIKQDITYQSFSIYRDLHCWEMSFNWQPKIGYYSFKINVKESILQDLKLTKRPSGRAYY